MKLETLSSIDISKTPTSSLGFAHFDLLTPSMDLRDAAIVIEDGKVQKVGSSQELLKDSSVSWIDASGFLITPGFTNAHTHVAMGFFRDQCHDESNMIADIFFPRESRLKEEWLEPLSYAYIYDGLRSGVTCFSDHYYFMDGICSALKRFGLKGFIAEHVADLGGAMPSSEKWKKTQKEIENWKYDSDLVPVVGPHAADSNSTSLMTEMAEFSKANDLPIHFHLAQTERERQFTLKEYGVSPVEWAMNCGALHEKSLIVHLVAVDDKDLQIIKDSGATIGFCGSSQILYEKLSPIDRFLEHDIPLVLGTDCAASNDSADILSELKTACLLARDRGASSQAYQKMFSGITDQPTRCLGGNWGDLKVGLSADLVFIKRDIGNMPVRNQLINLAFSTSSRQVQHVMVNGKWVLWNGQSPMMDEESLRKAYLDAVQKIEDAAKDR